MTPTSDERREVAAKLRQMADEHDVVHAFDNADIRKLSELIDQTCKIEDDNPWMSDFAYVCCDCGWWSVAEYEKEPTTELTCGYCRRFPPSCEILGEDDGHGQKLMGHPMCYAGEDVCGEFMPRDGERL